jgi:hypothetical protein
VLRVSDGFEGVDYVLKSLPTLKQAHEAVAPPVLIEDALIARGVDMVETKSNRGMEGTRDYEEVMGGVTWCLDPRRREWSRELGRAPPRAPLLGGVFVSSTGYFGNEASMGNVYVSTVLLVKVPAANDRELPELSLEEEPKISAGVQPSWVMLLQARRKLALYKEARKSTWISKGELTPLATKFNVSMEGTFDDVSQRIVAAAEAERKASWEEFVQMTDGDQLI